MVVLCVKLLCPIQLRDDAEITAYQYHVTPTTRKIYSKLKNRKISRTSIFQFMGVDDALVPLLSVSELSRPDPTTSDLVRQVNDAESEYHKQ